MTIPTPEAQVEFLGNLQRLLAEGSFVATYKHALLLALADLCVERGDDTGNPLVIPMPAIAEKIVSYYWRQSRPYPADMGTDALLRQNTGKQASIVTLVARALEAVAGYEDPRDSGCLTGLRRMPSSPSTAAMVVGPGELRGGAVAAESFVGTGRSCQTPSRAPGFQGRSATSSTASRRRRPSSTASRVSPSRSAIRARE